MVPVQLPIVEGKGQNPVFHGVVDLMTMKAFLYEPNGSGRGRLSEIPIRVARKPQAAHETLVELVAEGKDELMEEISAREPSPKSTWSSRSRGHSRRPDVSRALCQRPEERRQRPFAGILQGVRTLANGARADGRKGTWSPNRPPRRSANSPAGKRLEPRPRVSRPHPVVPPRMADCRW